MPKEHSSSRRKRFAIWLPVALLLLFGAYQTVMYVVRRQVDGRIAAVVGKPLFDFELTDRDGRVFRSRELRGKVVVLNFFRSKCAGCVAERDAVRALVGGQRRKAEDLCEGRDQDDGDLEIQDQQETNVVEPEATTRVFHRSNEEVGTRHEEEAQGESSPSASEGRSRGKRNHHATDAGRHK